MLLEGRGQREQVDLVAGWHRWCEKTWRVCGAGNANVVHGRKHTNVEVKASLPYSPRECEELRAKYRNIETTPESLAPSANVTTGAAVLGQSFSALASTSNPPKRAATITAAGGTFGGYWRSGRAIEPTRSFVPFVELPSASVQTL